MIYDLSCMKFKVQSIFQTELLVVGRSFNCLVIYNISLPSAAVYLEFQFITKAPFSVFTLSQNNRIFKGPDLSLREHRRTLSLVTSDFATNSQTLGYFYLFSCHFVAYMVRLHCNLIGCCAIFICMQITLITRTMPLSYSTITVSAQQNCSKITLR